MRVGHAYKAPPRYCIPLPHRFEFEVHASEALLLPLRIHIDQTHFAKRMLPIIQHTVQAVQARIDTIKPEKFPYPNLSANGPVTMATAQHPVPTSSHCHHLKVRCVTSDVAISPV
jgi:hypothetical protein